VNRSLVALGFVLVLEAVPAVGASVPLPQLVNTSFWAMDAMYAFSRAGILEFLRVEFLGFLRTPRADEIALYLRTAALF
jgi:hypothetical protein